MLDLTYLGARPKRALAGRLARLGRGNRKGTPR